MNIIRNIILLIVFIFIGFSCNQTVQDFKAPTLKESGWLIIYSNACFFSNDDTIKKKIIIKNPDIKDLEQINSIMKFTGLPQNFSIYSGNIQNAMATIVNNQRVIIYNKNLFENKNEINNSYWSSLFIMAHEIGHHLAANISDSSNFINAELEADRFAGNILYNMGADSNQVLAALSSTIIINKTSHKTKPSTDKRITTVKASWLNANKNRYESVIPPTADEELDVKEFTEKNLVFNSKWNEYRFENNTSKKALDTLKILNEFAPCKKLKGIIIDVQKIPNDPPERFSKDLIQLKIIIKIIRNEATCKSDFPEDEKVEFDVDYETITGITNKTNFLNLFVLGRRIEFDVLFLGMCDGCPYNISRAKAL